MRAEGYFRFKDKFTREKTLTAATYYGNHGTTTPPANDPWCDLLHCLTSDKVLTKGAAEKLRKLGINLEALKKCMEEHCPKPQEHIRAKPAKAGTHKSTTTRAGINIKSIPETQPVDRPPWSSK